MIFIAGMDGTMVLMLTEQDCNDMRGGRTKYVDKTVTKGQKFDKVVLSLHKNQQEVEDTIKKAGHGDLLNNLPSPVPQKMQAKCQGCNGIMDEYLLLESRCIACWRETARAVSLGQK